ncbi:spore coat polysaccharide biosynthesis protein SpsC [Spirochaetia bacterium]|nr:spore coat polysaccharide biosynthesis protein SpsC [Spirochaetia bacterium]
MAKKASDFRYNTGASKVPWAAVGENYNAQDVGAFVEFLMQGRGAEYKKTLGDVKKGIDKLAKVSAPPGKLSLGAQVEKAEALCDKYLGTAGSVLLSNCTAGFEIAYKYAGIGPGDEVIVPAITFMATMAYPLSVGAKLVFADIDPKTVNIDPADVERKITKKTKMIVPVDIGGYPVDMDPIMKLAKKHNLVVLEDAAHAFGAKYKGRMVGTNADFTGFSFHEVKNNTSFGEGGLLTTNIEGFRSDMKRARFLGLDFSRQSKDWLYDVTAIHGKNGLYVPGNASVTEIQALGLVQQMGRYKAILAERKRAAQRVTKRLSGNPAIIPQDLGNKDYEPTFHLYQIQIDPEKAGGDVQKFKAKMSEKGVTNIPHFGPLYRFEIIRQLGYNIEAIAKKCPVCENVFYKRYTHLPIYGLSDDQLDYMADTAIKCVEEMQKGK